MLKIYGRAFRSLEVRQTAVASLEHLLTGVICLLWVLASPFLALYALRRPTKFFLLVRWICD